jgi:hypothetical protein
VVVSACSARTAPAPTRRFSSHSANNRLGTMELDIVLEAGACRDDFLSVPADAVSFEVTVQVVSNSGPVTLEVLELEGPPARCIACRCCRPKPIGFSGFPAEAIPHCGPAFIASVRAMAGRSQWCCPCQSISHRGGLRRSEPGCVPPNPCHSLTRRPFVSAIVVTNEGSVALP